MNNSPFPSAFDPSKLVELANKTLGSWVRVEQHQWRPLYAWQDGILYNDFGEVIGEITSNTVYLCELSITPQEDLFHELGHAIAREFDFIGHRLNGFNGSWETRQSRFIAQIRHGRHWSPLLKNIWKENQREGNTSTPALGSEIWAEMFMSWYFYPDRPELDLISAEMESLNHTPQIIAIKTLFDHIQSSK